MVSEWQITWKSEFLTAIATTTPQASGEGTPKDASPNLSSRTVYPRPTPLPPDPSLIPLLPIYRLKSRSRPPGPSAQRCPNMSCGSFPPCCPPPSGPSPTLAGTSGLSGCSLALALAAVYQCFSNEVSEKASDCQGSHALRISHSRLSEPSYPARPRVRPTDWLR